MQKSDIKKPKQTERLIKSSLAALRRAYREAVARPEGGAIEWLRDNYYLLEREANSALSAIGRCGRLPCGDKTPRIYALCRRIAEEGTPSDLLNSALAALPEPLCTAELEILPAMLRAAYIHMASVAAAKKADAEAMGRAVSGLRDLPSVDFDDIIEKHSRVEAILALDPAQCYAEMDDRTRSCYRRAVGKMAGRLKLNEIIVAENVLAHAREAAAELDEPPELQRFSAAATEQQRRAHVGYYLPLCGAAGRKGTPHRSKVRGRALLVLRFLLPLLLAVPLAWYIGSLWLTALLWLPLTEFCRPMLEFFFTRGVQPLPLNRMNIGAKIPHEARTLVVVSNLVPTPDRAPKMADALLRLHQQCKSGEIKFCLLCDLKESKLPKNTDDILVVDALRREIARLNRSYSNDFMLAVRPRVHIGTQNAYAGWERKRGAITQLVRAIKGEYVSFEAFEGDRAFLSDVRYVIALDADSNLLMDNAAELVSAAMHPLNKPVINLKSGRVTAGYGIIAPRVGIDLKSAAATAFSRIMCGAGGVTAYDTLAGDIYQDMFGSSMFSGKGLINVDAFYSLLDHGLPEQRILSHDIIEGAFLRTAFMSDVEVIDGCPASAKSYLSRMHRWVRGDWQNIMFLRRHLKTARRRRANPVPGLSRYMLLDNLRRHLCPIAAVLCLPLGFVFAQKAWALGLLAMLCAMAPGLFAAVYSFFSGGYQMLVRRYYSKVMPAAWASLAESCMCLTLQTVTAFISADAALRALWRQLVSGRRLLEWQTAAETESRRLPVTLSDISAFALGAALLLSPSSVIRLAALFIISAPFVIMLTSRKTHARTQPLSNNDEERLNGYAAAMWRFYADMCTERDNHLPPDNMQETPVSAVAHRTSPTNIGLYMLCVLAARDFGFIDTSHMIGRLNKTLDTLGRLERHSGNLYNWYDTQTLKPLLPRFVSAVDNGNYACCLMALKQGLKQYAGESAGIAGLRERLSGELSLVDLTFMYNKRRRLFHIGYDVEKGELTPSYYDLLMSESRLCSYYSIATRQVPKKHWGALGRTLAKEGAYVGPVSWTGTMFEYYMPHILLPVYERSLGYEALRFCLYCQRARGRQTGHPWGISESGFYAFDQQFNYQYKAHGVQRLGLKRHLNSEYVLSPYSTFLALPHAPRAALRNLQKLESLHMLGRYGFYEAADYTAGRRGSTGYSTVRSLMAHHVGMSLLSVQNLLQDNINQRRFMAAGNMRACDELLMERVPAAAKVFRDEMERDVPCKAGRMDWEHEVYDVQNPAEPRVNLLHNGEYTLITADSGASAASCGGVDIYRRSDDLMRAPNGFFAMVREGGRSFSLTAMPDYSGEVKRSCEFGSDYTSYFAQRGDIETGMKVVVSAAVACESRQIVIKNTGAKPRELELMVYFEPCLTTAADHNAHPAFSKLFLKTAYNSGLRAVVVTRRARGGEPGNMHLSAGFIEDIEPLYDFSREALLQRPEGVRSLTMLGLDSLQGRPGVPDGCVAMGVRLQLPPRSQKSLRFVICAAPSGDEALRRLSMVRAEGGVSHAAMSLMGVGMQGAINRRLLPAILYGAAGGGQAVRGEPNGGLPALWSVGISGDMPIVVFELRSDIDLGRLEPYFSLHHTLRSCGISADLAVLYREGGDYARPLTEGIRELMQAACGCKELLGHKGGIHLLDMERIEQQCLAAVRAAAVYIAPSSPEKPAAPEPYTPIEPLACLPVYSESGEGYRARGGRFENGRFYVERRPDLPWCNVLCDSTMGTLHSDSSPGYTYWLNAREHKLTPWSNDTSTDLTGELLLMRIGGKVYNMINGSAACFSPRETVYTSIVGGIECIVTLSIGGYVSEDKGGAAEGISGGDSESAGGSKKLISVRLRSKKAVGAEICYYTEPVLGVSHVVGRRLVLRSSENGFFVRNPFNAAFAGEMQLCCSLPAYVISDRAEFWQGRWCAEQEFGAKVHEDRKSGKEAEAAGAASCAALCADITIEGQTDVVFSLGFVPDQPQPKPEPEGTRNTININTGNAALDNMMNVWLPHQFETVRTGARTAFYQCGGAYGFRDQLQDHLAGMLLNPAAARRHILRAAAHQFKEGDVLHWWHELPTGHAGVRTRCSDDYLWLPYVTAEYVERTGDVTILDEQVEYLGGEPLEPGRHERYFVPEGSGGSEDIYDHCLRALDNLKTAPDGLPLIGTCDWNDGFSKVGELGRGTSVWLAQFGAMCMERMAAICMQRGQADRARVLLERAAGLKEAVDARAWDGKWYRRAFFDDGTPMGAAGNSMCEIDILPQAFSVLSAMPDRERRTSALESALERLVNRESGVIMLFAPPFDVNGDSKSPDPGYIRGYPPGVRENGGQYTHAAVWLCMALLREGRADEAYELLCMINPAQRCADEKVAAIYKTEPYALAADVYSVGDVGEPMGENAGEAVGGTGGERGMPARSLIGRGGWSLYTGAAAWYYRTVLQEMLGIRQFGGRLEICPCLPSGMDGYTAELDIGGSKVYIEVRRGGQEYEVVKNEGRESGKSGDERGSKERKEHDRKMNKKQEYKAGESEGREGGRYEDEAGNGERSRSGKQRHGIDRHEGREPVAVGSLFGGADYETADEILGIALGGAAGEMSDKAPGVAPGMYVNGVQTREIHLNGRESRVLYII